LKRFSLLADLPIEGAKGVAVQTAFLIILGSIGLVDFAFSSEKSIAPVALLFVFLQVQANIAAARFLRDGLKKPDEPFEYPDWYTGKPMKEKAPEEKKVGEHLNVIPLAGKRKSGFEKKTETKHETKNDSRREPRQDPKPEPKIEAARAAPSSPSQEKTRPFFRLPKFTGSPHEVLGIQENAATRLIVQAFRHWIKRYHPDHARPSAQAESTEKARQLNLAKESLLERRKRLREHRAA
jgi:hypothetical protein